jgi:hypothetical protein
MKRYIFIKHALLIGIEMVFCIFFGEQKYVGHSFVYVAHFIFLRYVWIRTQRAVVTSRRATNLATYWFYSPCVKFAPAMTLASVS